MLWLRHLKVCRDFVRSNPDSVVADWPIGAIGLTSRLNVLEVHGI